MARELITPPNYVRALNMRISQKPNISHSNRSICLRTTFTVTGFEYFGSIINNNWNCSKEIRKRLVIAMLNSIKSRWHNTNNQTKKQSKNPESIHMCG